MRVGIATVQVPFIHGGAECHVNGLARALREGGHEPEVITMPFRFTPASQVRRSMDVWENERFDMMNGYHMDRVICMRFPSFYLRHPGKVAWVLHQHREVYELWGTEYGGGLERTADGRALRRAIIKRDTEALRSCQAVYANSRTVAERLWRFNRVQAEPLYHPPPLADRIYTA